MSRDDGTRPGPAADGDDAPAEDSWLRRLYELERGGLAAAGDADPRPPRSPREDGRGEGPRPDAGRTERAPDRSPALPPTRRRPTTHDGASGSRDRTDATRSTLLRGIREAGGFADIVLAGRPTDHRFGRVVSAEVVGESGRSDVSLRLFQRPDAEEDGFGEALAAQLSRWRAVSDLQGVVPLLEAAETPRPWACTAPAGPSLAERDPGSLAAAVREARALATALAGLHERGTVHAGIEPGSVVYAAGDGATVPAPLLDAPGLLDVYRRYTDPASVLDPRYAAPEYFETERGIVDRATDVYQLGTVMFRLFTGRAPYEGSAAEIREAVLEEDLPAPTAVEPRLPAAVDGIVRRAAATEKFERYGTAQALAADLDALCRDLLGE